MPDSSPKPTSGASPSTTPAVTPASSSAGTPAGSNASPSKPWNDVCEPGSYVCNDTGRLLRVPTSAFEKGAKSPIVEYAGPKGPSMVTRLSTDARLPVEELRRLSSTAKITPQF